MLPSAANTTVLSSISDVVEETVEETVEKRARIQGLFTRMTIPIDRRRIGATNRLQFSHFSCYRNAIL